MGKAKKKSNCAVEVDRGGGGDIPDQALGPVDPEGSINDQVPGHLERESDTTDRVRNQAQDLPDDVPPDDDGGGGNENIKITEDSRRSFEDVIPLFRGYLNLLSDLSSDSARALITEGNNY